LFSVGGLLDPLPRWALPEEKQEECINLLEEPARDEQLAASFREDQSSAFVLSSRVLRRAALLEEEALLEGVLGGHSALAEQAKQACKVYEGRLVVGSSEKAPPRVEERLQQLAREEARQVAIDVWLPRLSLADALTLSSPKESLKAQELDDLTREQGARASLLGLEGVDLSLVSISARSHVEDIEKVSGGLKGKILMEYDTAIAHAGEGLLLNATARLLDGATRARLRLRGELAREPVYGRQGKVLANEHRLRGQEEWVELDLPEVGSCVFTHDLELRLGAPVVLEVLPDPERPGECRALVVRVKEG
jgi:hypothetical protein